MDTIFMDSQISENSKPRVWILKFTDILHFRRGEESIALSNLNNSYTWENIKSSYNNSKFKISAPTWNDEFELPHGSYSISDIQRYFEHVLKKHNENIDNLSIRIYARKITNRITFKITWSNEITRKRWK